MAMSPERITERVDELIESTRHGSSHAFAAQNAALNIGYIRQAHDRGAIDAAQCQALVIAVTGAADSWRPTVDPDGVLLAG
jgi:hypothetical protein